eukprot:UN03844
MFEKGIISDSGNDGGCSERTVLTGNSDSICDVKCATGYITGTGKYVCSGNKNGAAATSNLVCHECDDMSGDVTVAKCTECADATEAGCTSATCEVGYENFIT